MPVIPAVWEAEAGVQWHSHSYCSLNLSLPSRTTGISAVPPPPPPLPPPAAPLPPVSTEVPAQLSPQAVNGVSRGALLSSIQNFQKGTLRKAETCDHSAPKIG
ncbi:PX domain-containing protein kinase-like protein [Plecturocebus cupreus]